MSPPIYNPMAKLNEAAPRAATIVVPDIGHREAQNASDLVEIIREKYSIEQDDFDLLYNCFLTVFVRGKLIAKN